jgi:hypothetical protein
LEIAPRIDWAWSLALAVIGLLSFFVSGVNKVTVVVGNLFLASSILSILRQLGWLNVKVEMPILVVIAGGLILFARMPFVPRPAWWDEPMPGSTDSKPN